MKIFKFLLVSIISIVYLFFIQDMYSFRDNINYLISYENIQSATNIFDAFISYKGGTGSSEPVYFILQYIFANLISYEFFTNILNFLFLMVLYIVIGKYFTKQLIAFVLILAFDYYLYRLVGELHRFKIAILFFMLFMYFDLTKYKTLSFLLSILSHFQMMIVYLFFVLKRFKVSRYVRKRTLLYFLISLIFIVIFLIIFKGALLSKLNYYLTLELPLSTLFIGILYFSYLSIIKDNRSTSYFIYLFIIIFPASFIVGADRNNIFLMEFIFIVELYKVLELKKYISLFIIVPIILYNIYRTIGFLNNSSGVL